MHSSMSNITNELNKFSWDSDEELVYLTRQHIINVLRRYQNGEINKTEIESWANAVEGREDIGREQSYITLIDQVLYELANPYLVEPLTEERAEALSKELAGADAGSNSNASP